MQQQHTTIHRVASAVKTLIPLIRFSVAFFPFPGWLVGWMLNHFVNGWMQVWEPNENHFPAAVDYYC